MDRRSWLPPMAAVILATLVAACGPSLKAQRPDLMPPGPVASPAPEPPPAPPPVDPVLLLIEVSQQHFVTGRREVELGHLERAKAEFNRAIEVLLESPHGARAESRIREHFDRLVDRISAFEITALAEGDGFTEKTYESASIDELLALSTFETPAAVPELQETVATDLQSTSHDIPIPLNQRVIAYVDLFQGRLRDWIQEGLARGSRYLPMIQTVFRAEGLPLDLAYVPLIESAFKPNALSRAKAKGVWQFMRGTARENGLKHDWYIDERSDPEKATVAAAKYLRSLHGLFSGDWHLALASYNGGPGRVQRAMKRAGRANFWALAEKRRILPRETREYVPMILAAILIARNPAQYGFTFEPQSPLAYETVTLPGAVDLRRVAEWAGVSIDEIQSLNPELRRWTTPVRSPNYELKVPRGAAEPIRQRLDASATAELAALNWHTVKRGESLASIARKLKVSRSDLAEANYLSIRARVATGQKLIIPRAPATLLAARADRPIPVAESRAVVPEREVVASAPAGERSAQAKLIYLVKRGDTLFSIARLYRTTVASIRSWNRIRGTIKPGDRLTIYASVIDNRGSM